MTYARIALLVCTFVFPGLGATFGKVVPIGGHMSDLAFDDRRGVLYVANFTANRIEVLSASDEKLQTPIYVPQQPGSIALSPDNRFLVVAHYPGAGQDPAVTILDLDANQRQTLRLTSTPFAVAFGNRPTALIVTALDYQLLDPLHGTLQTLVPHASLPMTGTALPVASPKFPPEIVQASSGVSADGEIVYVLAQSAGMAALTQYRVADSTVRLIGLTTTPPLGPRVISVNENGSRYLAGWALTDPSVINLAQIPSAAGTFNVGSHAFDWSRDRIYAHIPTSARATSTPGAPAAPAPASPAPALEGPVLHVMDTGNLTVHERLRLPENLAGRSVFSTDMRMLYSISDSGVTILPVASLANAPRVTAAQEDLVFRGNACDRRMIVQELDVIDPAGGRTDFTITGGRAGVRIFPASGVTPAKVRIEVDPTAFQNEKGTIALSLQLESSAAVNLPPPVRLLINAREPEQRGAILNVPGKLVDLLPDPVRDRFYVLRQDRNTVLVFDGTTLRQMASLRTGNTPTQMAITRDNRYMIVGNDNSQIANVYDLETLKASDPIIFPPGHYPRSIAVGSNEILATVRSAASPAHKIDRINFEARVATELPTLGIYTNNINVDTVLASSPSGRMILAAMPDGNTLLYDSYAGTFVAARKSTEGVSGALSAMTDDTFIVDNNVLNVALLAVSRLESQTGASSGFAFAGGFAMRTTGSSATAPGVIQRLDTNSFLQRVRPVPTVEAPLDPRTLRTPDVGLIGQTILPFIRTLAPLENGSAIASLSVSGVSVLPWDYDALVATPVLTGVRNAADDSAIVGAGSLIRVEGANLSASTVSNSELPVPTLAGESCLTVNGVLLPIFGASPGAIRAQLPYTVTGAARMVLRTPGGTSNPFELTIQPAAPAVLRENVEGQESAIARIYRASNMSRVTLSNPIHPEDVIGIVLTGLGRTSPPVEAGQPSPADPFALAAAVPQVTLGDAPLTIHFAGLVPNQVGVYEIVGKVPYWAPLGMDIPLTIRQGGQSATLNVRVVK